MDRKLIEAIPPALKEQINMEIEGMKFTKNFRSATAEEWYLFLPHFVDPVSRGAAGKVIVHYDLLGTKEVFINTTVIFDDPQLYQPENYNLVYALCDEVVNRLVGYADTLLSVHCGENSFQAEYVQ